MRPKPARGHSNGKCRRGSLHWRDNRRMNSSLRRLNPLRYFARNHPGKQAQERYWDSLILFFCGGLPDLWTVRQRSRACTIKLCRFRQKVRIRHAGGLDVRMPTYESKIGHGPQDPPLGSREPCSEPIPHPRPRCDSWLSLTRVRLSPAKHSSRSRESHSVARYCPPAFERKPLPPPAGFYVH